MTKELLKEVATMDLRDQLQAKDKMIKDGKESISRYQKLTIEQAELLTECKEWLKALRIFFTLESSINKANDLIKRIDEVLK